MRQTARHRSYVGSTAALSPHGLSPACRRRGRRPGFTLVEVVVAVAVLLTVSIAFLRFSVVSYDWGTNIVIRSMAQNLAELTAEHLAGSSITAIESMISSVKAVSPNFPANGTTWPDSLKASEVVVTPPVPRTSYYVRVPGEFLVSGITSFFPSSASQANLPTASGEIAVLDSLGTQFVKTGPISSDLTTIFGDALPDTPSGYSTYLYSPASSVTVEPVKHVDGPIVTWDSGLVLFRSEFPRFLREITVTRLFSGTPSDPTQARYAYSVKVIWLFSGHKQVVSVTGERSGVY